MKTKLELYGKFIGDDNIAKMIDKKEAMVLLSITNEEDKSVCRFVLNRAEIDNLYTQLDEVFNDAARAGVQII